MPTYLGVWSLGLFSPIFSPHPKKKKKKEFLDGWMVGWMDDTEICTIIGP